MRERKRVREQDENEPGIGCRITTNAVTHERVRQFRGERAREIVREQGRPGVRAGLTCSTGRASEHPRFQPRRTERPGTRASSVIPTTIFIPAKKTIIYLDNNTKLHEGRTSFGKTLTLSLPKDYVSRVRCFLHCTN